MNPTLHQISKAQTISDGVSKDKYVIGADLTLCQTKSEASKRIRNSAMCLSLANGEGQYISVLSREFTSSQPRAGVFINALAAIGTVDKNAIIYHELGNGLYWVGCVRNGIPLPSCDNITTAEGAGKALGEYFDYAPDGVLIGSSHDSLRSVAATLKKVDAKKRLLCQYKKPQSPYRTQVIIICIVIAIGLMAFALQSLKIARDAAELARQAALARLNESARIDAEIQKYNKDVQDIVKNARAEIEATVSPREMVNVWLDYITQQPLQAGGFRLDIVSCDVKKCDLTWKALNGATLLNPDGLEPYQRDDTTLLTTIPLPNLKSIPRKREERLEIVSRFHQIGSIPGLSLTVSPELAAIVVPTPSKPDIPVEMQEKLSAIQPVTVGYQSALVADVALSLIGETSVLIGDSVSLKTITTTPLTTNSGAALAPTLKLTGSYVRIP
ncbi:type 4b pilus protein PilO2 [Delftia sp. GW456-R20]|uniref:type 4b pilus protein PilO2 n=1 Tax=Delftia sp. GW456-R20 TaxID=1827145 RepID=UPI0018D47C1B|nr:type 4b pilus protein PilO2 [Delftia sp. GW456-R20]